MTIPADAVTSRPSIVTLTMNPALDIATTGIEPPSDTAVALAAAIAARAATDPALAKRLAAAHGQRGKWHA